MKTILIPVEKHDAMSSALDTVLLLARRCNSYMEGFALRLGVNEFVTVDLGAGFSVEAFTKESMEEARQAHELFESFMTSRAIPLLKDAGRDVSYGWLDGAPEGDGFVGSYGRVFDLIALSRPDAKSIGLHHRAVESALFESGRPVLITPPSAPQTIGTNVLIAWNCSTEQARATAFAMPLLRMADQVTVLTVTGGAGVPGPSAEHLIRYLQMNDIAAKPLTVDLGDRNTGEAILAAAKSLGCDLLVKGAYTQSRLRQMIFGGATRHILAETTIPVLMAN